MQFLSDWTMLLPGDLVGVPLTQSRAEAFQTENQAVVPGSRWQRLGRARWETLLTVVEAEAPLWPASGHAGNNRLLPGQVNVAEGSLHLIHARNLVLIYFISEYDGKRKVKIGFAHKGLYYRLSVTDPHFLADVRRDFIGRVAYEEALVCVSLTLPYEGYCYKLAAAIITPARIERGL